MIGNSWTARAGIKFVATIYSSLPIISCIYYISYVTNRKSLLVDLFPNTFSDTLMDSSVSVFLHYWLGFELVFHLYFLMTIKRLQKHLPPRTPTKYTREEILYYCLNHIEKFEAWLEGWFMVAGNKRAKLDQIYLGNFEEWLAWSFFSSDIKDVREKPEYMDELHDTIKKVEDFKKIKFPEGYNEEVKSIRLTLDPVKAIPRPFIFYIVIFLFNQAIYMGLRIFGFERHGLPSNKEILTGYWSSTLEFDFQEEISESSRSKKISYWYYNPSGDALLKKKNHQKQQPIVFIHGVGGGLWFYVNFIRKLYKLNRPLFLVELPHVSMRMIEEVPTMEDTVEEIEEMLMTKGFSKATFVSHSLGSTVCAWIIKEKRKYISGCVLIDPICFLLHHPDVAYNFVYREPTAANEHATYLFASRELYISYYFSRHFHWFQSVLHLENSTRSILPPNTHVYLSEYDNIVPSSEVYKYLHKNNVSVKMMRGLDHCSYLFRPDWEDKIVSDVLKCCNASRRSWSVEEKFFFKKCHNASRSCDESKRNYDESKRSCDESKRNYDESKRSCDESKSCDESCDESKRSCDESRRSENLKKCSNESKRSRDESRRSRDGSKRSRDGSKRSCDGSKRSRESKRSRD